VNPTNGAGAAAKVHMPSNKRKRHDLSRAFHPLNKAHAAVLSSVRYEFIRSLSALSAAAVIPATQTNGKYSRGAYGKETFYLRDDFVADDADGCGTSEGEYYSDDDDDDNEDVNGYVDEDGYWVSGEESENGDTDSGTASSNERETYGLRGGTLEDATTPMSSKTSAGSLLTDLETSQRDYRRQRKFSQHSSALGSYSLEKYSAFDALAAEERSLKRPWLSPKKNPVCVAIPLARLPPEVAAVISWRLLEVDCITEEPDKSSSGFEETYHAIPPLALSSYVIAD
jgi:hypothetical protein